MKAALVLAAAFAIVNFATAQSYPAKAIQMIVPLQAASAADITLRIVAQKMSETWGSKSQLTTSRGRPD